MAADVKQLRFSINILLIGLVLFGAITDLSDAQGRRSSFTLPSWLTGSLRPTSSLSDFQPRSSRIQSPFLDNHVTQARQPLRIQRGLNSRQIRPVSVRIPLAREVVVPGVRRSRIPSRVPTLDERQMFLSGQEQHILQRSRSNQLVRSRFQPAGIRLRERTLPSRQMNRNDNNNNGEVHRASSSLSGRRTASFRLPSIPQSTRRSDRLRTSHMQARRRSSSTQGRTTSQTLRQPQIVVRPRQETRTGNIPHVRTEPLQHHRSLPLADNQPIVYQPDIASQTNDAIQIVPETPQVAIQSVQDSVVQPLLTTSHQRPDAVGQQSLTLPVQPDQTVQQTVADLPAPAMSGSSSASTSGDLLFEELVNAFTDVLSNPTGSQHHPTPIIHDQHPQTALQHSLHPPTHSLQPAAFPQHGHLFTHGIHMPPYFAMNPWMAGPLNAAMMQEMMFGDTTDPPDPIVTTTPVPATTAATANTSTNPIKTKLPAAPTVTKVVDAVTQTPVVTKSKPSVHRKKKLPANKTGGKRDVTTVLTDVTTPTEIAPVEITNAIVDVTTQQEVAPIEMTSPVTEIFSQDMSSTVGETVTPLFVDTTMTKVKNKVEKAKTVKPGKKPFVTTDRPQKVGRTDASHIKEITKPKDHRTTIVVTRPYHTVVDDVAKTTTSLLNKGPSTASPVTHGKLGTKAATTVTPEVQDPKGDVARKKQSKGSSKKTFRDKLLDEVAAMLGHKHVDMSLFSKLLDQVTKEINSQRKEKVPSAAELGLKSLSPDPSVQPKSKKELLDQLKGSTRGVVVYPPTPPSILKGENLSKAAVKSKAVDKKAVDPRPTKSFSKSDVPTLPPVTKNTHARPEVYQTLQTMMDHNPTAVIKAVKGHPTTTMPTVPQSSRLTIKSLVDSDPFSNLPNLQSILTDISKTSHNKIVHSEVNGMLSSDGSKSHSAAYDSVKDSSAKTSGMHLPASSDISPEVKSSAYFPAKEATLTADLPSVVSDSNSIVPDSSNLHTDTGSKETTALNNLNDLTTPLVASVKEESVPAEKIAADTANNETNASYILVDLPTSAASNVEGVPVHIAKTSGVPVDIRLENAKTVPLITKGAGHSLNVQPSEAVGKKRDVPVMANMEGVPLHVEKVPEATTSHDIKFVDIRYTHHKAPVSHLSKDFTKPTFPKPNSDATGVLSILKEIKTRYPEKITSKPKDLVKQLSDPSVVSTLKSLLKTLINDIKQANLAQQRNKKTNPAAQLKTTTIPLPTVTTEEYEAEEFVTEAARK